MSFFPLKFVEGGAEWRINRTADDVLLLTCVSESGQCTQTTLPLAMVLEMSERIVAVANRLDADTKTARQFHKSVPPWPADIFDEENYDD